MGISGLLMNSSRLKTKIAFYGVAKDKNINMYSLIPVHILGVLLKIFCLGLINLQSMIAQKDGLKTSINLLSLNNGGWDIGTPLKGLMTKREKVELFIKQYTI